MEKKSTKIAIIGAGISGLVAALILEKGGYVPTIYETSDRVGGRVKTDVVEGYQLDHGYSFKSSCPGHNYLKKVKARLLVIPCGVSVFCYPPYYPTLVILAIR